ncbi:MAG: NADH-quinone oxidoreductase subunit N [Methanobacteriota archaeon]|nr:MAG: NADH-quinone oxidoreductase subunit N [Euryarchaeota archaeon]
MGSIAVLLPEIILVTAALGSAVLGFLVGKRTEILWAWALVTLVAAMVLTLDMMGLGITRLAGLNLYEVPVSGVPGASGDLVDAWKLQVDTFTLFFHIVFMFVALLAVLASRSFIKPEEPHQGEYYCLLFLAVVGMMLTAAATDLFVLYLAFEISSISTFALVAFRKKDKQATEAALKFFIIGSVSSAIILFGISLVYGVAGSSRIASVGHLTDLAVLKGKLSTAVPAMEAPLIVAIVFLLAGFGFKVAVVPFHMWAPDVYQGSPTTISTFLAAGSKKVGIVALFKVFLIGLLAIQIDWIAAIAVIAIVTQTVGNLFAIPQRNIKRMLAYSSIAHAGYVLMGLAAFRGGAAGAQGDWSLQATAIYLITHARDHEERGVPRRRGDRDRRRRRGDRRLQGPGQANALRRGGDGDLPPQPGRDPPNGGLREQVPLVFERGERDAVQPLVPRARRVRRPEQRVVSVLLRSRDLVHVDPGCPRGRKAGGAGAVPHDRDWHLLRSDHPHRARRATVHRLHAGSSEDVLRVLSFIGL